MINQHSRLISLTLYSLDFTLVHLLSNHMCHRCTQSLGSSCHLSSLLRKSPLLILNLVYLDAPRPRVPWFASCNLLQSLIDFEPSSYQFGQVRLSLQSYSNTTSMLPSCGPSNVPYYSFRISSNLQITKHVTLATPSIDSTLFSHKLCRIWKCTKRG